MWIEPIEQINLKRVVWRELWLRLGKIAKIKADTERDYKNAEDIIAYVDDIPIKFQIRGDYGGHNRVAISIFNHKNRPSRIFSLKAEFDYEKAIDLILFYSKLNQTPEYVATTG